MALNKEPNFYDDLLSQMDTKEALRQHAQIKSHGEKIDQLIHKVFAQSEAGAELLSIWKESLIMNATAVSGMDLLGVGINEGQKGFIRGILLTIKRIEGE